MTDTETPPAITFPAAITHERVEGLGYVQTQEALEVWQAKGWTLVDPSTVVALDVTDGQTDDLSKLTKEQLVGVAAEQQVPVPDGATKQQIIDAIQATHP